MGKSIGIDLGTSNSVVADAAGAGAKVLDSNEGRPQIRSVVGLKKSRRGSTSILVGDAAENNWEMSPKDTIVSVKRLMGRGVADSEVQKIKKWAMYEIQQPSDGTKDSVRVVMGGKEYSPIDISAMILEKIKKDAELRLDEKVTHAVITVPAYFSQAQKAATRQAGLQAGMTVIKILDEPTAAAVCYGIEFPESEDPKYLLVYDLGGGTFDISVLLWAGNVFQPLNLQGDMWLGGDNFDQAIVERTVRQISKEEGIDPTSNKRFMVALTKEAQKVKIALSSGPTADLVLPGKLQDKDGDYIDVDMEVTREEFEGWVQPLVDRTIKLTEEAMKNAGLSRKDINYVLMAGNSSKIPLVRQAIVEMFGKDKIKHRVNPKHCVAMGAAIVATRIGERVICQAADPENPERECGEVNAMGDTVCKKCKTPLQLAKAAGVDQKPEDDLIEDGVPELVIGGVAPFSYGTQTVGDKFNVFIKKNDPYPTETPKSQTFYTSRPKQRKISIPIYGGDCLDKASKNDKQGEAFAILPSGLPKGTAIRILLRLNSDGIFDLTAHLEDGSDLQPWIMQGETDQETIEQLEEAEQVLFERAQDASPDEMEQVDQARNEVLNRLRDGDFHGAGEHVDNFQQMVGGIGRGPIVDPIPQKAENLINYTQYILSEYDWAFDTEKTYQLNNLIEETREALRSDDRSALEQLVDKLDRETDNIPDIIRVILGLRGAINRLKLADPVRAANLAAELAEIENDIKAGDRVAAKRLDKLAMGVAKAIQDAETQQPCGEKCAQCETLLRGKRYCPKCKADSYLVVSKKDSSSTITSGEMPQSSNIGYTS